MTTMTERELTLAEVAASLRVSVDTARELLARGEIQARKQGRQWRVLESDVEAYKQRLREQRKK
jgi:excisionase family DNA binding protein